MPKGKIMKIVNIIENLEPDYLVCLEDWNKDLQEVKSIKQKWYNERKRNGLRIKIAIMDNHITGGMIEYMPIEYSYARGSNLYIVNCIWVHGYEGKGPGNMQGKGIGTALLHSAEREVLELGMDGLAVWGISEKM
jgi:hypothetical protein